MKINVVDIPKSFIGKEIDGNNLKNYLEDVKTKIALSDVAGNEHPIFQNVLTLLWVVQILWNENDDLKTKINGVK